MGEEGPPTVTEGHICCHDALFLLHPGRTAASTREDLAHLMERFSNSSALLRVDGKPLYYVYDSYHIPASDWKELLSVNGSNTVRGTAMDGKCLIVALPKAHKVVMVTGRCIEEHA